MGTRAQKGLLELGTNWGQTGTGFHTLGCRFPAFVQSGWRRVYKGLVRPGVAANRPHEGPPPAVRRQRPAMDDTRLQEGGDGLTDGQ